LQQGQIGVISVDILSKIRRWHLRDKMPIREITRRTSLSRNTIKKYLRSDVIEPVYPARVEPRKLDPYAEQLAGWLKADASRPRRERRTARALYQALKGLGFDGDYSRVTEFIRRWREEAGQVRQGVFVPLLFAPGEALQFDWSSETAEINGEVVRLKVAQIKLCHSRMTLRVAYPSEAHEMLFDAHWRAFQFFGGIPKRAIYDNMKTAVDKVERGKSRQINQRFLAMMGHYLLEPDFCNRAAGWEKGRVEKGVQDGRRKLFVPRPRCDSLAELNAWLRMRCLELAAETGHPEITGQTVAEVFAQEKSHLLPVGAAFDAFIEHPLRVSPTCLVSFERNRYSVHAAWANKVVSLRAYADHLKVVADGEVIAEHARRFGRGHTAYDWRHYLPVLERKPGALRNGAPFAELPAVFQRLQVILLKRMGGDREMADILGCVPVHGLEAVEVAVGLALEGKNPSREHVFNILARLKEPGAPADIDAPQALALSEEPKADVSRYDALRILLPLSSLLPVALEAIAEVRHAA
jgi:transposase